MVGIVLEKQTLEMNRAVSRQYFQLDLMLEMHAKLRLSIQEQTAPALLADLASEDFTRQRRARFDRITQPESAAKTASTPSLPLMRWQLPARSND